MRRTVTLERLSEGIQPDDGRNGCRGKLPVRRVIMLADWLPISGAGKEVTIDSAHEPKNTIVLANFMGILQIRETQVTPSLDKAQALSILYGWECQ